MAVTLLDTITNIPGPGLVYRYRFLAPAIAAITAFDVAMADMQYLCDTYAMARLPNPGPMPSQIVITLLDRPVAFGEIVPDATQFFEAYRIEDGRCIWESL